MLAGREGGFGEGEVARVPGRDDDEFDGGVGEELGGEELVQVHFLMWIVGFVGQKAG